MKFYEDKEYIKMCEKAVEIQKGHPIKKFDFFQDKNSGDIFSYDDNMLRKYIGTWIWLPRQDQLQEMIKEETEKQYDVQIVHGESGIGLGYMADLFSWWFSGECHDCPRSMEEIHLAYYMRIKFNKTWNGEEWVENK